MSEILESPEIPETTETPNAPEPMSDPKVKEALGEGKISETEYSPSGETNVEAIENPSEIPTEKLENLPENVQAAYNGYESNGWQGNFSGQTEGTAAGGVYHNVPPSELPETDIDGNDISYREFDVNNHVDGEDRDGERFVVGSDNSVYYTADHYTTFTKIERDI